MPASLLQLVWLTAPVLCICVYFLCDILWPEVMSHSDDSHVHANAHVLHMHLLRLFPQSNAFISQCAIMLASFPGLHAQLLSLAERKVREGLEGFIT